MTKQGSWIEVFKVGTHTSANGVERKYTHDDLTTIANLYNSQQEHEAPLVIGHPETDSPAYGWAKELKLAGDKLLAYVDKIHEAVVEAVNNEEYKKVSIALYPGGLLRHIGLLGAVPPAVKGLASVKFAAGTDFEEYVWATDETRMPIVARVISAIRDLVIEKFGLETADKVIDKDDVASLAAPAQSKLIVVDDQNKANSPQMSYADKNLQKEEQEMDELKKLIEALSGQFSELQSKVAGLEITIQTQADAATQSLKATALTAQKSEFATFCEQMVAEGKVLAAEKDGLIEEYNDILMAEETLTFAEGSKKPSVKMKERIGARPILISRSTGKPFADGGRAKPVEAGEIPAEFSEVSDKVDPASVEVDKAIRAYAEEHKVSYEEAAAAYSVA